MEYRAAADPRTTSIVVHNVIDRIDAADFDGLPVESEPQHERRTFELQASLDAARRMRDSDARPVIAVLVTDALPNGNLVIQGMRVVTFSGETQYVVLNGLVRRDDIAPDNTIASSNIADARLEFYTEGQLTDAQKRGWFTKLYEKLRPF